MSDEEIERRKSITFAQAEGAAALPSQLQPKEISDQLRSMVWAQLLKTVQTSERDSIYSRGRVLVNNWRKILFDRYVYVLHRPADDFDNDWEINKRELKHIIWNGDYVEFFDFLQYVLRHAERPYLFADNLERILRVSQAAYILVDGKTFVPKQTKEEAETFVAALNAAESAGLKGPRQHLLDAAGACSTGHFADSVRNSIHAVESVAVQLAPGTKELGPALKKLDEAGAIHGAMKAGFASLYGFASDEQGIRHSLLDKDAATVDEADAMFMLGACAAFVSYLINKGRAAGLL
ncbi:hypothetical protein EJ077_16705 [Mesorhizobium sp. M8A.F.Ca.ET.057.01.1.1]|uniref:AbiJ-NTD4 domain-containing protein n=1 Tax=Mesorhizobium sp. M8A.F.Ca.ET.057.01.1.1 TaxID=2493679 RepID=UPI000F753DB3|nr:hypothetical protein [Mesorhizobium sp. M8A.F.Ca.ET.057.01.1.1]AZO54904.1 hypothetical protein EJ077_16705 [Mesorhizobium sp. M8A.F.Ca.ET.057.01.1.1]